jgi:hypothetical protein
METARQIARESCLIPWMNLVSAAFSARLLPFYETDKSARIAYDLTAFSTSAAQAAGEKPSK